MTNRRRYLFLLIAIAVLGAIVWLSYAQKGSISADENTVDTDCPASAATPDETINSLNRLGQTFEAIGGTGSVGVNVTKAEGCYWSATSNVDWVVLDKGPVIHKKGSGDVTFSVTKNTSSQQRSGTLIISGHTFVITQAQALE